MDKNTTYLFVSLYAAIAMIVGLTENEFLYAFSFAAVSAVFLVLSQRKTKN